MYARRAARSNGGDPRLDLCVAVATDEEALLGLRTRLLQRARDATVTKRERLLGRIDVMKMQSADATIVAAEKARSTGLRHEDLLYASTAASDSL